ncbi:hypothetical protein QJS10_CPB20g00564 [Acorus calamus]|uniref:Uncharacterized protein n=1 Tax=Acorus calamus TaxID=4465 RepID=A0AAV9CAW2_ACOCL|nr:hypothetical protein QJS10_CPB20g00564 [Acorus calamus]
MKNSSSWTTSRPAPPSTPVVPAPPTRIAANPSTQKSPNKNAPPSVQNSRNVNTRSSSKTVLTNGVVYAGPAPGASRRRRRKQQGLGWHGVGASLWCSSASVEHPIFRSISARLSAILLLYMYLMIVHVTHVVFGLDLNPHRTITVYSGL